MKAVIAIAGVLLAGAVAAEPAAGQVKFGAALSWGDDTDIGLGARLNFGLGSVTTRNKIEGRATFDFFFPDGFDYWQITGDGIYHIPTNSSVEPYVGGGLGFARSSSDSPSPGLGGSSSDVFLNLIGGLRFRALGNVRPFAEARFQLGDGSQLVLAGGIYFGR
jgi:hypothetical protein